MFEQADTEGAYLTDEVFLYRIVAEIDGSVELEDCYGLDVVHAPSKELSARRFRVVIPDAD